jgi:spore maturation protein CgeB
VPTFRDAQELGGLLRYYLAHEDERKAIAASLPAIVAGETFDARVGDMLAILQREQ